MTRAQDLEQRIRDVSRLRDAAPTADGFGRVREALRARSGRLVARGAAVAGAWCDASLVGDLVSAFERLLAAGAKADPGCTAKTALVDALGGIGEDPRDARVADRVFLAGARHEQWEAVWGGRSDTAGGLRGASGAGLAAWHHPEVLLVLADHLADPLPEVRAEAARSLGRREREDAVPLLRLRLAMGDEEPRVLGECARALLALAPESSVPRIVVLLGSDDEAVFGEAALALGESRLPAACDALCAAWSDTFEQERRRVILAALGAARREEAIAFLLRRVVEEAPDLACTAVDALAPLAADEGVRARLGSAVAETADEKVAQRFESIRGA